MNGLVHGAARLILAVQKAWTKKWSFFALSLCAFFISVITLGQLDLLPDPSTTIAATNDSGAALAASAVVANATTTAQATNTTPELPVKIAIPAISLSATVANPTSTDVDVLDNDLLSGAVRYPTSAKLGVDGNVVIFGHSSYLPIVHNQAYKTFDGIQKLKQGDTITVYSSGTAYTYAVASVTKMDATSSGIPLTVTGKVLTLSTCDSFASKNDRFVVTANFVESHLIAS